jgi:isopentenyl-diphosphate delta-isomerase
MTATEYIVLVDHEDREIGTAEKITAHRLNQLHRAFSVFIFRHPDEPELLLQQRAAVKYHSADLWTNTCCSHPRLGEPILDAGTRRLKEELGLSADLIDVGWFHYQISFDNGLSENEIDHVLVGFVPSDIEFSPDPSEVQAYRWIGLPELQQELAGEPEQFTHWFKQAFEVAKEYLKQIPAKVQ